MSIRVVCDNCLREVPVGAQFVKVPCERQSHGAPESVTTFDVCRRCIDEFNRAIQAAQEAVKEAPHV